MTLAASPARPDAATLPATRRRPAASAGASGVERSGLEHASQEAGAADSQRLAWQLQLLYDGASVSARMDHDPGAALPARLAAEALISAALD